MKRRGFIGSIISAIPLAAAIKTPIVEPEYVGLLTQCREQDGETLTAKFAMFDDGSKEQITQWRKAHVNQCRPSLDSRMTHL